MARYKGYADSQPVMIPVSFENQLLPGALEVAIQELVERRMATAVFGSRDKNDETGCPAYAPKILLKVILLAYARGIISSRKIEQACRANITFMALACGQVPDHSTLAAFVASLKAESASLFRDVLLVCAEQDLLGGTPFALDGVKLLSHAAKEWSGTFADLRRKQEKLEAKLQQVLAQHERADKEEGEAPAPARPAEQQRRQGQLKRLAQQAARIAAFLAANEPKRGKQGQERQSNLTENESAKMFTAHGVLQGYKSQALVDAKHQVSSEEPLKTCAQEQRDAYIPDPHFRHRDPRFATQGRHQPPMDEKFTGAGFRYDQEHECSYCPGGKVLKLKARHHQIENNIYRRSEAEEANCSRCPLREGAMVTDPRGPAQTSGHLYRASQRDALTKDDRDNRHAASPRDLWAAPSHCGTGLWQSPLAEALRPLYGAGKDQSEHSMDAVLYSP